MNDGCLCILGEVLFDHFPDGARVLGGAPFNVAWHLQAFGQAPCFISRVGNDSQGEAVLDAMRAWGMRTDALQVDAGLPTGRVQVTFDEGEPAYEIVEPVAYDAIAPEPANMDCRLLYQGTLAMRSPASRRAGEHFRAKTSGLVFVDVNLRPPWWRRERVLDLLRSADWVKLNQHELKELQASGDAEALIDAYELSGVVLTHGAAGAEVLTADGERARAAPARDVAVVDTVGAGDAFAAVVILGLSLEWELEHTVRRAQDFASGLVGQRGATVGDPDFYRHYADDWHIGH